VTDRVLVGQHSIAYRRAGSGPPLVLLHGFLCDSRVWRPQLEDLADDFDVIAWDAPGAGDSTDPPSTFTMADWVACLVGFLDAIGVGRAHVVGLSWGGILAQELFRWRPDRIDRLVLADTYAGWKGSMPEEVCAARLERCEADALLPGDELAPSWAPEMFTPGVPADLRAELSAIFAEFHPHGFRLMAKTSADTDTTDVLPSIQALLLWGAEDRRSPLAVAERIHAISPLSKLVVIPAAGHVSNMERPDTFNAAVRRYLL
jgi:pimeloyl-ACP methyl ester carboxylesterase